MSVYQETQRSTPVLSQYDVVVLGGGPGGIAAAVAAGRQGTRVLLVERLNFLGGNMASGLPLLAYFNARREQIIHGFPDRFVKRLQERNGASEHVFCPMHLSIVALEPETVKYEAYNVVKEAGVDILLNTEAVEPIMEGNKIRGVIIENKSGRQAVFSKFLIDATGDADLAYRAGAPCEIPETKLLQPMTLMFRVGQVDINKFRQFILENPEVIKCMRNVNGKGFPVEHFRTAPVFIAAGFENILEKAKNERKDGTMAPLADLKYINLTVSFIKGQVNINSAKVLNYNPVHGESLTGAENEGRLKVFALVQFFREYIPGFENAQLLATAEHIGVRESRRIIGEYVLNKDDVETGRMFPDNIALGCYPIDIHQTDGRPAQIIYCKSGAYGIPYRCLLPRKIENLLIAGRPISTTREAFGSTRVMPTCMAVGEAAGTAAALAVKTRVPLRDVNVGELQELLQQSQVKIYYN